MRVLLAAPRGFCAGVDRAIEIVEKALGIFGPPIYVRHAIVHNRHVVEELARKGAVFVEETSEIPEGAVAIFSAHGVSKGVWAEARARNLRTIDATCPLVTKVHLEAIRLDREGYEVILIGHAGHVEVEGTMGQLPGRMHLVQTEADAEAIEVRDPARVAYVTQTTLSVDDTRRIVEVLRRRFPAIVGPKKDDICYATQNRQDAVKRIAREADVVLVVGSPLSSNSNRLREVAEAHGARAHLVESADGIDPAWLDGARTVGVTSGASTPDHLVADVIDHMRRRGAEIEDVRLMDEDVHFVLPQEVAA
jgi:4-hydroxy-3-methylbut-2-enyl diphosphate reductase